MKYKLIFATVLAGITANAVNATSPHCGFSIGINPGVTAVDSTLRRDLNATAFPGGGDNSNLGRSAPHVGLFLGYAWSPRSNALNVGVEAFGQFQNVDIKRQDNYGPALQNYLLKLRSTNAYGASVRLGVIAKETLLYAKLGFTSSNWKVSFTDALPVPAGFPSSNQSKRTTACTVGVGIDHPIAPRVTAGIEYLFSAYGAVKTSMNVGTFTFKPRTNAFNLRLKYTF